MPPVNPRSYTRFELEQNFNDVENQGSRPGFKFAKAPPPSSSSCDRLEAIHFGTVDVEENVAMQPERGNIWDVVNSSSTLSSDEWPMPTLSLIHI